MSPPVSPLLATAGSRLAKDTSRSVGQWQAIDVRLRSDPHEAEYRGNPADLVDAVTDLYVLLERPEWHR